MPLEIHWGIRGRDAEVRLRLVVVSPQCMHGSGMESTGSQDRACCLTNARRGILAWEGRTAPTPTPTHTPAMLR